MSKKPEITKKRHLEMVLQNILPHTKPKVHLEQYTTPANIAAAILWNAYSLGDIEDNKVVDMGCGTGIFAVGAVLMGARKVMGIDIDPDAIEIAKKHASEFGIDNLAEFISGDVKDIVCNADTVIQNPPFGAQKAGRKNADRIFMKKAIEIAPVVYSFHMKETEEFVEKYFASLGGLVTHKFYYSFNIPKIYDFHRKEKINIDVVVFRIEKNI
ncbi:MAG: methyltransferase [Methanobacterium sp.]|uniref:METTL5 family protein n=1 Tax=Methanobacterium sp. TaxID=2164 RepID=UPI003D646C74|nr:methyltransferase [Methanobacterium sp.]